MALDYKSSGVDRDRADALVSKISRLTGKTLTRKVRSHVGGYASLYELSRDAWIAASTDGVGTKLKLAFELGIHDTVGEDLVAMSVNDLLCVGAEPLFFLDYFATGQLNSQIAESVIAGIAQGCALAQSALVGGETAEMPGFYAPGEYDLAGFAVGKVRPRDVLPRPTQIRPGDRILGIASSGLHSNGFSLFRKWIDQQGFAPAERTRWLKLALTPTRIYVAPILKLLKAFPRDVRGLAHITGSGFLNVPRISDRVDYEIRLPVWKERASIYGEFFPRAGIAAAERLQTWNCGVGMVCVVSRTRAAAIQRKLAAFCKPWKVWDLGEVKRASVKGECHVRVWEQKIPGISPSSGKEEGDELERVDLRYS